MCGSESMNGACAYGRKYHNENNGKDSVMGAIHDG